MDDRKRRLLDIIQAFETARLASPARGPGWSVCFEDGDGHLLVAFTLGSYQQVEDLARDVATIGFDLAVLDQADHGSDFVFRPRSPDAAGTLLRTAVEAHADRHARRGALPQPLRPAREQPLEQGALVMQQGGGPVMLLSALSRDLAYCVWFSETAQACSGTFMMNRLVNVDAARRQLERSAAGGRQADG